MKKGIIIAAVVLVLAGLALFTGALAMNGWDITKLGGQNYVTGTIEAEGEFHDIVIDISEADISLLPSTDGKCSVEYRINEKVVISANAENGVLRIGSEDTRGWIDRWSIGSKSYVNVYLPEESYAALTVKAETADVSVPANFSFESVDISTGTGAVAFAASAEGKLKIKTDTGDIRLDNVSAGEAELSVSTGDIKVNGASLEGGLSFRVSTGSAELKGVSCASLASTGSTGGVTLKNVIVSGELSIERSTGDVKFEASDAGSIRVKTSTGDVTGSLLTEKVFIVKTSTGSVGVPDSVTGGRCEISTTTGDVKISVG